MFLGQKSEPATADDRQVITDLQDTLKAHRDGCVGMAANMIGYKKRIIIVSLGFADLIMQNPVIKAKSGEYETEEGCLSLTGKRNTGIGTLKWNIWMFPLRNRGRSSPGMWRR